MTAAITAGVHVDGAFADAIGTDVKALAPMRGGTLLDAAIVAARDGGAKRVVVIGGDTVRARVAGRVDRIIDESHARGENLRRAMSCGAPDEPLLLLASDLPFLTSADVAAFVACSRAANAAIAMPLANADARRPRTRVQRQRRLVRTGGGDARARRRGTLLPRTQESLAHDRAPRARVARTLHRTFAHDRRRRTRARALLRLEVRAIRDVAPALCYDVDTLADYRYALAHG